MLFKPNEKIENRKLRIHLERQKVGILYSSQYLHAAISFSMSSSARKEHDAESI